MSTTIRPEISKRNPYYISKHRYYELKHFCLQYKEWKEECRSMGYSACSEVCTNGSTEWSDPTGKKAIFLERYIIRMRFIEDTADEVAGYLSEYILKSVTEGKTYVTLKTMYDIPMGRDRFYELYRRFFWLLSKKMNSLMFK